MVVRDALYVLQTNGGGLSPAQRQVATAVLLGLIVIVALLASIYYRKELYKWFNTIPRVTLGTIGAAVGLGLVTVVLLIIWGQGEELLAVIGTEASTQIILQSLLTAVVLILAYGVSALFSLTISRVARRQSAFDDHSKEIVTRFTQVTSFATGLLIVFSIWNINIGNLLLGAGFLGVILGLAARQTLSSSLAGFVLMLAQPFKIGDWVEINDKRGRVMEITIVNTRIRATTGETIIIPNDKVLDDDVTNLSGMGRLQLYVDVGVDYGTDIEYAQKVTEEAVGDVDDIMETPGPTVYPEEFGDSSVILRTYFWIEKPSETRRRRARASVISAIQEAYDEEGITIPFPQRTLSNRSGQEAEMDTTEDTEEDNSET